MRWRWVAVVTAMACLGMGASSAAANPLKLVASRYLDARLEQLTFTTPAVRGPTDVRVLYPSGYGKHAHPHYPVLYLLHGALDNDSAWTAKGEAEQITRDVPVIVVMPSSGTSGGYANWFNNGAGGPPEWETYHIDQLIPWIDAHLHTRPTRAERAIAGLSMGGFGAMSYAARHPDLFAAAASFSGAVDTNNPLDIAITGDEPFGPRLGEEVVWRGHNPTDLAENLRGLQLTIRTGNGLPGGPYGGGPDIVEQAVHEMSVSFHDTLSGLRIRSVWDDYGPGAHQWPYWERDLRETLPSFMSAFAHPRPAPAAFTFTAVEPQYGTYGWAVALRRKALEFSTLRIASPTRFSLTGSGAAVVSTPTSRYRRGGRVLVEVTDSAGTRSLTVQPDRQGALHMPISLGTSNTTPEYTPAADQGHRASVTARVRILGVAGGSRSSARQGGSRKAGRCR